MTAKDWFRHDTWSKADQDEFERRLARARTGKRAQYLRIQAVHLAQSGDEELLRAALALLSRVVTEYPTNLEAAPAHSLRAECLVALGEWGMAVEAFRAAFEAERAFPNVRTGAYLRYGFLVVTKDERSLFSEVAHIAKEQAAESRPFPVQQFEWHVVQALLADAGGDAERARREARAALASAVVSESGFRYHPTLGLASEVPPELESRLRRLASSGVQ